MAVTVGQLAQGLAVDGQPSQSDIRLAKILWLRYVDVRRPTLEAIGKAFGLTRERVRQLEARALVAARKPSQGMKLKAVVQTAPRLAFAIYGIGWERE